MKIIAVIAAGGAGKRLGGRIAKPYFLLGAKPMLAYSLEIFEKIRAVNQVILVVEKNCLKKARRLVKKLGLTKVKEIIPGGFTRSESVQNGMLAAKDADYVIIHDAARPFVSAGLIGECIKNARIFKAAVAAVPCTSTIKSVDRNLNVISTLDRKILWQVQTPQVFALKVLKEAYARLKTKQVDFFDDASLVERLPHKVKIVMGEYSNIKITTREDLKIAKAILAIKKSSF